MKQRLLDVLEFYSEATPKALVEDGGKRASDLLIELNDTEHDDGDMLTVLLDRAERVLDSSTGDDDKMHALRVSIMEWQD